MAEDTQGVAAPLETNDGIARTIIADLAAGARAGATDDELAARLADLQGEPMIAVEGPYGRTMVKVKRVHGIGPHYEGGTVVAFNGLPDGDPMATLIVKDEVHKIARWLRDKGWPH